MRSKNAKTVAQTSRSILICSEHQPAWNCRSYCYWSSGHGSSPSSPAGKPRSSVVTSGVASTEFATAHQSQGGGTSRKLRAKIRLRRYGPGGLRLCLPCCDHSVDSLFVLLLVTYNRRHANESG